MIDGAADLMESWFSAEARSVHSARHAVRCCLVSSDLRLIEEVELLTSELFVQVTAAAHGEGRVCIRIRQSGRRVHVEVAHEQSDDAPTLVARDPLEGAILERLLDAFSTEWGRYTSPRGEGATWFEMTLTRLSPAPISGLRSR
jgi:hypothetical protein